MPCSLNLLTSQRKSRSTGHLPVERLAVVNPYPNPSASHNRKDRSPYSSASGLSTCLHKNSCSGQEKTREKRAFLFCLLEEYQHLFKVISVDRRTDFNCLEHPVLPFFHHGHLAKDSAFLENPADS